MDGETEQENKSDNNNSLKSMEYAGLTATGGRTVGMETQADEETMTSSSAPFANNEDRRMQDTWATIQASESKEQELLDKIQDRLEKMHAVVEPAREDACSGRTC